MASAHTAVHALWWLVQSTAATAIWLSSWSCMA
eukprot:CAMPEP_0114225964 /NCGR_PEP_ID=MMETSP0058-20121206/973_1 /TAXON_ID=36894 /ORGANISM="Pyramimonas parkeae, CCMP726" /LENGTH=32 /DNA_ID= /DNA_START= /DNA_END= /DNA_ORIENTATION=